MRVINATKLNLCLNKRLKFHPNFIKWLNSYNAGIDRSPTFIIHDFCFSAKHKAFWLRLCRVGGVKDLEYWVTPDNKIYILPEQTSMLRNYNGKVFINAE